ncbi:MAG TPA: lipase family protein [Rhodopila sp.]|nr:lipase family protein [Rhodopila sp.]
MSAFYSWSGDVPATPGRMLRSETLDPVLGLAGAGEQRRILYTSTDGRDGKTPVVVSGAYFVPRGTPPAGGWPLVAWAHGTTGVADICAPSWNMRSKRDATYLNAWLGQGYAIVATDYQGLGTPGPHPYLLTRPEAYSVLDSVRAVLRDRPDVANKIVVIGQSQGGQAAFATGGIAPVYAPELGIRGIVATGVPFIGAGGARRPEEKAGEVDPTAAYSLYIAILLQQGNPVRAANQLIAAPALPLLERARTTCVATMFDAVREAGVNRSTVVVPGFGTAFRTVLPEMEYSTLRLPEPVFVGTGAYDRDVPPAGQLALVRNACVEGTVVQAHLYAGLNHGETVNASLRDSVPFVRKVLAGEAVGAVCEPVAQ